MGGVLANLKPEKITLLFVACKFVIERPLSTPRSTKSGKNAFANAVSYHPMDRFTD